MEGMNYDLKAVRKNKQPEKNFDNNCYVFLNKLLGKLYKKLYHNFLVNILYVNNYNTYAVFLLLI